MSRLLEVYEAVAIHGPATLDQLQEAMPRTRSSVYRALIDLEQNDWITRSLNGRTFTVSYKMEHLCSQNYVPSYEIFQLIAILKKIKKVIKSSVAVAAHIKGNEFSFVDSSIFPFEKTISCSEITEAMTSILLVMRADKSLGISIPYDRQLGAEAKSAVSEGLTKFGFVEIDAVETTILPLFLPNGEVLFILCRCKEYLQYGRPSLLSDTLRIMEEIKKVGQAKFVTPKAEMVYKSAK